MNVSLFAFPQGNVKHVSSLVDVAGGIVSLPSGAPLNHLNALPETDYSYDFFKTTLLRHQIPFVNYQFQDGFFLHAVASLAAGTCGTSSLILTCVLHVYSFCSCYLACRCHKDKDNEFGEMVSRIAGFMLMRRAKSGKASPVQVLVKSLREEGPAFMFKGWTPAFMRLGPNTVLMFVFFEVSLFETSQELT